eukprot:TRINITY_DN8526_c0_g1_i1.p1 TRINITY_DN8526_c0_g1~~TRINITY_DN8526_c0_g1_i1.p1  ORF type:complete len:548 (+),score=102.92 TRINITY_DN8526_c0_g1_i1:181-1644(+)
MVTGGLQHTDVGNASCIGGIAREFFVAVERSYPNRSIDPSYPTGHHPTGWLFESHVAEVVMWNMLHQAGVRVVTNVGGIARVQRNSTHVLSLTTITNQTFMADVWIDGSYEGDLIASSNITWTVGRESARAYNESYGGRRPIINNNQFQHHLSPYWPNTSTVLPLISHAFPGNVGDGDNRIMSYDYRLCMTNSATWGLRMSAPPANYNASRFELLRRVFAASPPSSLSAAGLCCLGPIPNNYSDCGGSGCKKCDMIGCGAVQTDFVGASWQYVNGSQQQRARIIADHVAYTQQLLWFLRNDTSVPTHVRQEMASYGLCKDEYLDTTPAHWPHQLYVREGRRMVGQQVFTQHTPANIAQQSIGMGSYVFDCHHVQRVIHRQHLNQSSLRDYVVNEGEIMSGIAQEPYGIPYSVLVPQRQDATNVLAAVPVSASHVRYASLRMEPTWMIMGQAAGTAAAMAIRESVAVQDVDVALLQSELRKAGAILSM